MEKLPHETIAQIFEMFPKEDGPENGGRIRYRAPLAQFSSVSRVWKASIERITFRELTIATDELDTFAALFKGGNISRHEALVFLSVVVILPDPANAMGCCAVTRKLNRKADTAVFTAALTKLFTILADTETRTVAAPAIFLTFTEAVRHSRTTEPRGTRTCPCQPADYHERQHSQQDVLKAEARAGQFKLVNENLVPQVTSVKTFELLETNYYNNFRDLRPTSISKIVSKLPHLECLSIGATDLYEWGGHRRHAQKQHTCNHLMLRS